MLAVFMAAVEVTIVSTDTIVGDIYPANQRAGVQG
jgi:hypothetical protein